MYQLLHPPHTHNPVRLDSFLILKTYLYIFEYEKNSERLLSCNNQLQPIKHFYKALQIYSNILNLTYGLICLVFSLE